METVIKIMLEILTDFGLKYNTFLLGSDKFLLRVIAREGIRVILARTCAIFYDG